MATAIPLQTVPSYGGEIDSISWTAGDDVEDHEFSNDGNAILLIRNGDASPRDITIVSVADRLNRLGDLTVTVPAGEIGFVGPLPIEGFNQPGGVVSVTLDDDTSIEFAAIQLPRSR